MNSSTSTEDMAVDVVKNSTPSSDSTSNKNMINSSQSKVSTLSSGSTYLKGATSSVDTAMDIVSESMVTILTLASYGEHSDMVDSFIMEILNIKSDAKADSKTVISETTGSDHVILTKHLHQLDRHSTVHGQVEPGEGGPIQPGQVLPPGSPGGVVQNVSRAGNLWSLARLNCDWPLH